MSQYNTTTVEQASSLNNMSRPISESDSLKASPVVRLGRDRNIWPNEGAKDVGKKFIPYLTRKFQRCVTAKYEVMHKVGRNVAGS